MSVWVAGLVGLRFVVLIGGFSLYWVVLRLVYLGGVFILLVYVRGSDYIISGIGGGGFLVFVGLVLVFIIGLLGDFDSTPDVVRILGFRNGGFVVALITAPALLWVIVNVN